MRWPPARPALLGALALVVVACSGPILANPTLPAGSPPVPTDAASRLPDPQPIVLPRDDGPHDRLTEWWYDTGHLHDDAGGRWGFEFVVFRAERGDLSVAWASHLAITDEVAGTFRYDQRSAIGPAVDQRDELGGAFAFVLPDPTEPAGADPTAVPSIDAGTRLPTTWWMAGDSSRATLTGAMDGGSLGIQLETDGPESSPPVLHGMDGWVDFGPAGGSYYYSRPRLAVRGNLASGGRAHAVEGTAWFDHQWGDFISVGGGGWDWFAVNLDDGTDLTLSLVRAADGTYPLVYGTLVRADGRVVHLPEGSFTVTTDPQATWTSPASGATYPAGWTLSVPGDGLIVRLAPTVADQELDTRASTGVTYWEGSQVVSAARDGQPIGGAGYVELTGYAPGAGPAGP